MPGIAVVEDESIVALDIKGFLDRNGYPVAGLFSSGEELLECYEELRPELILMDIKIRGALDGVETAKILYEKYHAAIVLLTAFADDKTVARAKLSQPFGYVLKPFEERELKTAIEIALYRSGMEGKLRESEERYRNLFTEGISGNFLADAEGRIADANPAFRSLMGIGPEDPLPGLSELFRDAAAWESFRAGLAGARYLRLAELSLRAPGDVEVLAFANAAALFDASGAMIGIRGELADATERRRLEERLMQAQKMEAIGRLAGGIAHDFNNILTAILGYSNLLSDEIPNEGEARADLDGIRSAAGRAANLTRQLLAFSRRQPYEPRPLDLNALVQDSERLLRRLLTEGVSLALDLGCENAVVFADPMQIEQILLNLVVNAKDAMPGGGSIGIATRAESLESSRRIGLDTLAAGDYVVLEVRDTGTGIDPKILDRIFEPFFTTKPKERGTGLGLSTVYGITKQSGGAVGLESAPGRGAVFSVWLPLARVALAEEQGKEGVAAIPPGPRGTILLVDDDDSVRSLASRLLAKRGHRMLVASNAVEALLIAESYGRRIDLLVADAVMPFMDGYSLARRLEEAQPGLAVLFVSGHPERASDPEAAGRFLAKPFAEPELAAAVAAAMTEGRRDPSSDASSPAGSDVGRLGASILEGNTIIT